MENHLNLTQLFFKIGIFSISSYWLKKLIFNNTGIKKIINRSTKIIKLKYSNLTIFLFKKKIENNKINGTILKPYSISCRPKGNIDVRLSLKYFSSGLIKKDKNIFLKKEKREWNSVGGYFLGKFSKKNNTAVIFDKDIKIPIDNDKEKLMNILKFFINWE